MSRRVCCHIGSSDEYSTVGVDGGNAFVPVPVSTLVVVAIDGGSDAIICNRQESLFVDIVHSLRQEDWSRSIPSVLMC